MNQLPTCLDINAECDNEPCMFHHDHKCTFHCRQWRHVNTGYQNQSERSCEHQRIEVYPDDKFVYCQSKIECDDQQVGSDGKTVWCNKPLNPVTTP